MPSQDLAEGPLEAPAPAVPLLIQEWVEARVQIAMEQSKAAAAIVIENQEFQLAAAIEEVAARSASSIAIAMEQSKDAAATAMEQSKVASANVLEKQEMQLAAAIEEVAARSASRIATAMEDVRASLHSARGNSELRIQIGTQQAMSYAEHGVAALGLALKGVAKALALVKRDVESATAMGQRDSATAAGFKRESEAAIHGIETDLKALQTALESQMIAHDTRIASVGADVGSTISAQVALEGRINDHEAKIASVGAELDSAISDHSALGSRMAGTDSQIAALSTSIGTAVSDYNAQLRSIEQRVEFVRKETMYELQASMMRVAGAKRDNNDQVVARIVDPEKIEKMRKSGLRLNVGCGHIQSDDYINVDARQLPGVDVIAQAEDMPFADEEIQEISSSHVVEHFSSHVLERVLLPHWKSLLRSGGQLTTVAPDGAAMLAAVNNGTMSFDDFREVLFGGQEYDGDFHYNLITPDSFSDTLARAGFVGIEAVYTEKKNGKCFEFKIIARKP